MDENLSRLENYAAELIEQVRVKRMAVKEATESYARVYAEFNAVIKQIILTVNRLASAQNLVERYKKLHPDKVREVIEKQQGQITPTGPGLGYTPQVTTPKLSKSKFSLPIILTLAAGIGLNLAAVSIPGCRKATPPKPAAISSVTSESQEAKEDRIKAQIQALLQNLGEGASYDPQLNLTAPITRMYMLTGEAEFKRLEMMGEEGRLRFVKVAEKDMPLFYKLAQELNAVIEGYAYLNAFTLTTEEENGLPVYTVIINEKEFQKPPVELWITFIHEVFGRVAETEMFGKLGSIEAEEARAYRKEAQVLDLVIRCNDSFIQHIQQMTSSEEDLKLLRQVLDRETLIKKKDNAEQKAKYYEMKANTKPIPLGKTSSLETTGPGGNYTPVSHGI